MNEGGDPLNPPTLLDSKLVNDLNQKSMNKIKDEEIEQLQLELEQLRLQIAALEQENVKLKEESGGNYDLAMMWHEIAEEEIDYEAALAEYLASLKLGKQAPEYKRTKEAVEGFINYLRRNR